MSFESDFGELMKVENIDNAKILQMLIDPKNIDMKTHILDPITFASLEAFIENLEDMLFVIKSSKNKLPKSKKILKLFIKKLKMFLVSWERQSRTEVVETLKSNRVDGTGERSLFQKLINTGR